MLPSKHPFFKTAFEFFADFATFRQYADTFDPSPAEAMLTLPHQQLEDAIRRLLRRTNADVDRLFMWRAQIRKVCEEVAVSAYAIRCNFSVREDREKVVKRAIGKCPSIVGI